jgi:proteasome lid subunit RPN8/RPN11
MTTPNKAIAIAKEPKVEIDSEVSRRIRQHARAHSKTEVCGILIGEDANGIIEIRASIEALNAAQAGTHVTFTQDAWEAIYRVKDELYPEDRIVGWYHSHPGFGVFLSEHDMFIQQNFFSSPGQVAWVYDPHSDEEGCFGWVCGEVHRLSSLSVIDRNGDGVERTPTYSKMSHPDPGDSEDESSFETPTRRRTVTSPWPRRSRALLTHVSALLIGFTLSYFLFPRVLALMIDPATGELIVRDGRALLPYLDQRIALPPNVEDPKQSLPAHPPPSASPSSTTTVPAQPASPRSTH